MAKVTFTSTVVCPSCKKLTSNQQDWDDSMDPIEVLEAHVDIEQCDTCDDGQHRQYIAETNYSMCALTEHKFENNSKIMDEFNLTQDEVIEWASNFYEWRCALSEAVSSDKYIIADWCNLSDYIKFNLNVIKITEEHTMPEGEFEAYIHGKSIGCYSSNTIEHWMDNEARRVQMDDSHNVTLTMEKCYVIIKNVL